MPAQLFFKTEDGGKYPVIFKHGDDLRQDQLILQIISLMDKVRIINLLIVVFLFSWFSLSKARFIIMLMQLIL